VNELSTSQAREIREQKPIENAHTFIFLSYQLKIFFKEKKKRKIAFKIAQTFAKKGEEKRKRKRSNRKGYTAIEKVAGE